MSSPTFDLLKHPQIIRAGAGAGKTTTLISTFINFCQQFKVKNNRLPNIVITTFTRKATQEIKERLLIKALETSDEKLFHHINKKHSVHISTIHGLLTIFLNQNAELLGLPIALRITDSDRQKNSIRKILKNLLKSEPHYYELIEHYRFSQIVDLVSKQIDFLRENPEAIAVASESLRGLSFQKKSELVDLLEVVFSELGQTSSEWKLKLTDKGFASWAVYLGQLKQSLHFLKENKIDHFLKSIEDLPDKPRITAKTSGFSEVAQDHLNLFLKKNNINYSDTEDYFQLHESVNKLFFSLSNKVLKELLIEKKITGEITINDLELFSLELVLNHPESIKRFQLDWDYFMIDEYQDTSPLQVKILDKLIQDKPFFIVGDPQQSIYLFRGARSEVFLEKEKFAIDFPEKLELRQLQTNYRSEPSLMHFMNNYFTKLGVQFQNMQVRSQDELIRSQIDFIDTDNQLEATLHKILDLIDCGVNLKDICVLSRKNNHLIQLARLAHDYHIPMQLQVAAGYANRREIIDLAGFLRFLVNPYDNENLILLLRSPWFYLSDDEIYYLRQNNKAAFENSSSNNALWLQLDHLESGRQIKNKLILFLNNYKVFGSSTALLKLVTDLKFLEVSDSYDSTGRREANFWKFYDQLKKAEQSAGFLLANFLSKQFKEFSDDLGSLAGEASPVIQPNRVNLMSIHASKGLQFKHVIIIGFSDKANTTNFEYLTTSSSEKLFSLAPYCVEDSKNISSNWAVEKRKDFNLKELAEHERFLYVALTRAEKSLTLVSQNSKKFESAWRQLGFWPEEGHHQHEHYDLLSIVDNTKLDKNKKLNVKNITVRSKYYNGLTEQDLQLSVTSTLEEKIEKQNENKNLNFESFIKAQLGTDLHRLFESLKYNSLDELRIRMHSDQIKLLEYVVNEKEIPFQKILVNGHVEMGFGIKTTHGVLQGQIDLWANVDDSIYVIDYKTGRSEYQEKAFEQLMIYTVCLQKMKLIFENQPIYLIAWYVGENKLIKKSFKNNQDFIQQVPDKILNLLDVAAK